jgi:thioredoxin reductase (NADPH)
MIWDSIIVGGGIAGLQAAIQLGRYEHRVLVIDSGYGRSTLCKEYHNVLGWPEGISGEELRKRGRSQAEALGVQFVSDEVVQAALLQQSKQGGADGSTQSCDIFMEGFMLTGKSGTTYESVTLLLATGLLDRIPDLPGIKPCLGLSIYVCPDCDGYELKQKQAVVMGSGDVGAEMALVLRDWTDQLIYINHERKPVKADLLARLEHQGIMYLAEEMKEVISSAEGKLEGVRLQNGSTIQAERGFIAFGGNEIKSDLAHQLGAERLENRHIVTDPRSKMTNVPHLWAAGDVGVHAEQVTIAMGEGAQAAIWMHKALMKLDAELGMEPDNGIGLPNDRERDTLVYV